MVGFPTPPEDAASQATALFAMTFDSQPKPIGRPSSYTPEIADLICERIADGESLRSICSDEEMPNKATVFRWLAANDAFRDQYARARESQADTLFDDILEIADDARNDWMERRDGNRGYELNGDHIQRSRLRLEARKWMASKLAPKKYGDRILTEHSGSLTVRHEEMTDDELARIAAGGGE